MFVPEAWRRAESEREGRRQVVKLSAIVAIALAAIGALVYAVIAWSRGRSDRRAVLWAGGLSLAMVVAGGANNWPTQAFALRTAEPVVNQLAIAVLGSLAGALVIALLFGLLAGGRGGFPPTRPRSPILDRARRARRARGCPDPT